MKHNELSVRLTQQFHQSMKLIQLSSVHYSFILIYKYHPPPIPYTKQRALKYQSATCHTIMWSLQPISLIPMYTCIIYPMQDY